MNRHNFPPIALGLSVVLAAALLFGGRVTTAADGTQSTALPLLTLLAISEFGLVMDLIAAALGIQHLRDGGWNPRHGVVTAGCLLFALLFLSQLIRWWPL
jgi:hypothetical protein